MRPPLLCGRVFCSTYQFFCFGIADTFERDCIARGRKTIFRLRHRAPCFAVRRRISAFMAGEKSDAVWTEGTTVSLQPRCRFSTWRKNLDGNFFWSFVDDESSYSHLGWRSVGRWILDVLLSLWYRLQQSFMRSWPFSIQEVHADGQFRGKLIWIFCGLFVVTAFFLEAKLMQHAFPR